MATVYALICWCGKNGKTVTFTDAGDVVNLASHGIRSGYPMPLVFTDNGNTLPTGLAKNTTYYGAIGADGGKFLLYPTNADAIAGTNQVTFTGAGSGTHKVKSAYYYDLSSVSRWTLGGTEHVYDSLTAMVSGFSSAIDSTYDAVAEIVGQWDDVATSGASITSVCNTLLVTTLVNGSRSTAFHDRLFGTGYRVYSTNTSQGCVTAQSYGITLDGFEITYGGATNNSSYMVAFGTLAGDLTVRNMLGSCASTGAIHGVQIATGVTAYNNIVAGIPGSTTYTAFRNTTGNLSRCYNNIAVGNPIGFEATSGGGHGYFYNNIAVGNVVNWGPRPLYSASKASHNACEDDDKITFTSSGSGSTLTFASPHQYQGNTQIFLYSTGSLPTVGGVPLVQGQKYWVRSRATTSTMTIGLTDGGTALTFDGAGSGTHYIYTVWGSEDEKVVIDYSTPSDVFADPTTTLDFAPATIDSPQVETGTVFDWFYAYDMVGNTFPAYPGSAYDTAVTAGSFVAGLSYTIASVGTTDFASIGASANTVGVTFKATGVGTGTGTATLNAIRDLGALEFDLGYGDWPALQTVAVSNVASGTRIKIAKQSDGTELYNDVPGTSLSYTESLSASTAVYVYARKGSAATYYHPLKLSATIDPEAGLSLSLSGLQIEDIAAHDYTGTAVATDWSFNLSTGAITHDSGTTRYSVRDLYSWHQDYTDGSTQVDDDPLMHGTTPTIFELINTGSISDADMEDLYGGSIEFPNGDLWTSLWTTNTMAAAHSVYVVQGGNKYTAFWSAGPIDVLLQVADAGTLRDSGLVDVYAREYGYTYAYYQADLSAGGRVVAPLATLEDATTQAISSATAAGYTDVGYTFGSTSQDLGEGGGAATYYCRIDCAGRTLEQVFARTMYDCRDVSTTTLNGAAGWKYRKAHSSYVANDATPFGSYSGGFWNVAQGVWLDNVASADQYSYKLTDHAGMTHQLSLPDAARGLAFTGLVAGSQVKVFDTGTDTERFSTNSSGTSETWSETTAGSVTVDYTVMRAGYHPIHITNIEVTTAVGGVVPTPIQQQIARAYVTSSGLTYGTNTTANVGTKRFGLTADSTLQNYYSHMIEVWIAEGGEGGDFANTQFPITPNGSTSFSFDYGWEWDGSTSIAHLSRDGMRYKDAGGTVTAMWAAILTSGVPTGLQVRYQQQDGLGTTSAASTGNMDELVQIYGDATHGNFDYTDWLVLKVQAAGYDQAEAVAADIYGTLEDQLYVFGLTPLPDADATWSADATVTVTAEPTPVEWPAASGKYFSITITDTTDGHSGLQILRAVRAENEFNWSDLVRPNGSKFKTVTGNFYGDAYTTPVGVRVVLSDGTTPHPDFDLFSDDTAADPYVPPVVASAIVSNLPTAGAHIRLQIYNMSADTIFYSGDPGGATYNDTYVDGVGISAGDTLRIKFVELNGTTSFKSFSVLVDATTDGFSVDANNYIEENESYATNATDGSAVTKFTADFSSTDPQINLATLSNFTAAELYAYYCYLLTDATGIGVFWGGITSPDPGTYRINVGVCDMYVDNETTGSKRQTDAARIYRSDGAYPVLDPTTSGYGVDINWQNVVYAYATASGITTQDKTDIAQATLSAAQATPIHSNAVTGDYTAVQNAIIAALPSEPPTSAANATAVRAELAVELGRIDAAVSSRATPADVPSATNNATATKSMLSSGPLIPVDVMAANGSPVAGTGASDDKIRFVPP